MLGRLKGRAQWAKTLQASAAIVSVLQGVPVLMLFSPVCTNSLPSLDIVKMPQHAPNARRIPYDTHAFAGQGDYSEHTAPLMDEYKVPLKLLQSVYRREPPASDRPADNQHARPITNRRTLLPHEDFEDEDGRMTPQAVDQLHQRRTTSMQISHLVSRV